MDVLINKAQAWKYKHITSSVTKDIKYFHLKLLTIQQKLLHATYHLIMVLIFAKQFDLN